MCVYCAACMLASIMQQYSLHHDPAAGDVLQVLLPGCAGMGAPMRECSDP